MRRRFFLLSLGAAMTLAGCSVASQLEEVGGKYELQRINGDPLPYDEGPAARLCGYPRGISCESLPPCRNLTDRGALRLDRRNRTAIISWRTVSDCAPKPVRTSRVGEYQISGDSIAIGVPRSGRGQRVFTGTLDRGCVELTMFAAVFLFCRR